MENFFSTPNLIFWAAVIITVIFTTATLGERWRRQENYRWAAGWFLVHFWGFWMVWAGYFDANTWLSLFFAVGFCGMVKVGYEGYKKTGLAEQIRVAFRREG